MDRSKLLLAAQRSLWGVDTPNLIKVYPYQQENTVSIYFYYDNQPSELEEELFEDAATEFIASFPHPILLENEKYVVSYPQKIEGSGFLVYSRYEP